MKPVENGSYQYEPKTSTQITKPKKNENTDFSSVLEQFKAEGGFPKPSNSQERNWLWNLIASEKPELLESDVSQGRANSLEDARAQDIRDNLVNAGVDLTTAVIIASREASTKVERPDGIRPGSGASGFMSMPESIKSEQLAGNSQVREGTGYAYVDRYGFSHVTKDLATAMNYSGNGSVFEYNGTFGGGYPLDGDHDRAFLDLPQARMYANAERVAEEDAEIRSEEKGREVEPELPGSPEGKVKTTPLAAEYIEKFAQNARMNPLMEAFL